VKIAIASGNASAVELLQDLLGRGTPPHEVAWVAPQETGTVWRCQQDRPELLLLDAELPGAGREQEVIQQIRAVSSCGILLFSTRPDGNLSSVYEAMSRGALDCFTLRLNGGGREELSRALLAKLARLAPLVRSARPDPASAPAAAPAIALPDERPTPVVAIGSSTGGPQAVAEILGGLPRSFPGCLVIVQHFDPAYTDGLTSWLSEQSGFSVRLAASGDRPAAGEVLVAAADRHLVMRRGGILGYETEPSTTPYRPNIDVFFRSLASHGPPPAAAVLLTGMGADGAVGLKLLRHAGWLTIAQDRATSVVYGMPKAAAEMGAASMILPLNRIAHVLRGQVASARARP
jgi:two-component system, chemotaxis family, response regulator WspF